ncbi:precorrin-8X methylmutase [Desulfococcus sp.]|uniref:precorrin-8X methylmutase n=1 Tax=Desulfococcus sp. TaxID=2025834 RepID=UPI003592FCE0
MKPQEIESLSFQIIDREAAAHDFDAAQWEIVRRMIHTSADFEYMETVRFHPLAVSRGIAAIRGGSAIITDTEMAMAGIRKAAVESYGGSVACLIGRSDVRMYAEKAGITRARAAVDMALPLMTGSIYVVGNAPTALLQLIEQIREGQALPALVIGLPVGFVNAAESKAELLGMDVPYITNIGRKGGSNVAASVVNALLILAGRTS